VRRTAVSTTVLQHRERRVVLAATRDQDVCALAVVLARLVGARGRVLGDGFADVDVEAAVVAEGEADVIGILDGAGGDDVEDSKEG
jgi:hypothetical protein